MPVFRGYITPLRALSGLMRSIAVSADEIVRTLTRGPQDAVISPRNTMHLQRAEA